MTDESKGLHAGRAHPAVAGEIDGSRPLRRDERVLARGRDADWLAGGGEMARLILAKDWSKTPLGPIGSWPQSLRTTVSLVQASKSPISIAWGPGNVQIYNDGYWPICGAKHPASMGQDFRECWASALSVVSEAYYSAWTGKSAYLEKVRMFLDRYGFLEEAWFTVSFSPITDENGNIAGLFHPVTEMTAQMLSERRIKMLRDLAERTGKSRSIEETFALCAQVFSNATLDLPFTLLYQVDEGARQVRLAGTSGIPAGASLMAPIVESTGTKQDALAETVVAVARDGEARLFEDRARALEGMIVGAYPEPPRQVMVLPIFVPGVAGAVAVLVAGVSPRLQLNDAYRDFYQMTAAAVGGTLANARAHEEERHRAEALAEIDRAKTAFFSNISHEFRTPLTLMLGPLTDALAERESLSPLQRERLELVHRNSLRLLRLVNMLLDFSRIEAGRMQATFRPTDLSRYTAELASLFRSAMEKAGLAYVVQCPRLPEAVYVDRDLWEKIVLNLLSNAFKHTFRGTVSVTLRWVDDHVDLVVADTGIGIPETDLPRIFERFHRIKGSRSRTHEGSGIGLALVQELVRLHGGRIQVASEEGRGTTFTVSLQTGRAHLPPGFIEETGENVVASMSDEATTYSEEAIHWLPDDPSLVSPVPAEVVVAADEALAGAPDAPRRPRIVLADDNADMRAYVRRLLEGRYEVIAVSDGEAALAAVKESRPDLVLSDIMMPKLDGIGVLKRLREDPRTREIPIMLLSARAGEEAAVSGLSAGADDYLVKPFSAKELLARVRAHVDLGVARRKWARDLERTNAELEIFSSTVSHDLREPLGVIKGYVQLLTMEYGSRLNDAARDYLLRIDKNTQKMASLIESLLRLSRINRTELRRVRVDLSQLAGDIVAELRASEPERQVEVFIEPEMQATADSDLMAILLDNLLRNAWKFTAKRPDARIDCGVRRIDFEEVFFVKDNGAGFDMAASPKLFRPFQRLHASSEFSGTGIGLTIVQQIVSRHGGRVWAEAEAERGATFYFTLG